MIYDFNLSCPGYVNVQCKQCFFFSSSLCAVLEAVSPHFPDCRFLRKEIQYFSEREPLRGKIFQTLDRRKQVAFCTPFFLPKVAQLPSEFTQAQNFHSIASATSYAYEPVYTVWSLVLWRSIFRWISPNMSIFLWPCLANQRGPSIDYYWGHVSKVSQFGR